MVANYPEKKEYLALLREMCGDDLTQPSGPVHPDWFQDDLETYELMPRFCPMIWPGPTVLLPSLFFSGIRTFPAYPPRLFSCRIGVPLSSGSGICGRGLTVGKACCC